MHSNPARSTPKRQAPTLAAVITAEGLTKIYRVPLKAPGLRGSFRSLFNRQYRTVTAVDGIELQIEPGERVGFLGPNGAGKTTTLKMLSGLLVPTAGSARVLGHEPHRRSPDFLGNITLVMGQKQQLLWDLPPRETFELNRALYGIPLADFRAIAEELIALLELGDIVDRPARNLSLGERMKCELAAALLHRPQVLFLDEPTIGLDVSMQVTVREFIADWNRRHGVTVMLTSHYMEDIAALCPRVVIIDKGRIRYDGSLERLSARYAPDRVVRIHLSQAVPDSELAACGPFVAGAGGYEAVVPRGDVHGVTAKALAQLPIADLTVEDVPLEAVLRRLFEDAPARGEASQ